VVTPRSLRSLTIPLRSQQGARAVLQARGYGRSGNEAGPLRDLPDWEYEDGTPAPVSQGRRKSANQVKRVEQTIERIRASFPTDPDLLRIKITEGNLGLQQRAEVARRAEETARKKALDKEKKQERRKQRAAASASATTAQPTAPTEDQPSKNSKPTRAKAEAKPRRSKANNDAE